MKKIVREMVDDGVDLPTASREFERLYVEEGLRRTDGNVTRAAELLGVHRNTLRSKRERTSARKSKKRRSPRRASSGKGRR